MIDKADDSDVLLEAVKGGDQDALASLFSGHRDRLRRMIEFRLDARPRGPGLDLRRPPGSLHRRAQAVAPLPGRTRGCPVLHLAPDGDLPEADPGPPPAPRRRDPRRGPRGRNLGPAQGIEASSEKMAEFIGDFTSPSHGRPAWREDGPAPGKPGPARPDRPRGPRPPPLRGPEQPRGRRVARDPDRGGEQAVRPRAGTAQGSPGTTPGLRGRRRHDRPRPPAQPDAALTGDRGADVSN